MTIGQKKAWKTWRTHQHKNAAGKRIQDELKERFGRRQSQQPKPKRVK